MVWTPRGERAGRKGIGRALGEYAAWSAAQQPVLATVFAKHGRSPAEGDPLEASHRRRLSQTLKGMWEFSTRGEGEGKF